MDISEFSILSIFIRTGPCSGLNELEEEYDCKDIIMIIILKMSYFWKFGPFSDSNPFQLYSHHILCPTGPICKKNKQLQYPPFNIMIVNT